MKTISIDIETYSDIDLSKSGMYRYVESPSFDILLFGYSVDGSEIQVIDLAQGEAIPREIIEALVDENVIKWAFNAAFERVCLSAYLRRNYPECMSDKYLSPNSWRCSMIWSAYMGLPLSLEGVGAVLGLEEQKLKEGRELIRYFCSPCKATKSNGGRTRNLPVHNLEKWKLFKAYNKRDVEVEMAIQKRLQKFPVPDFVWEEYHLDQQINDRGIAVDLQMVKNAIKIDELSNDDLFCRMQAITKLENPNSVQQMKQWLLERGIETESLDKKSVIELKKDADKELDEVLTLRQQLAKSSVKKYQAMENVVCKDSRVRGMFQFYGANRSGRWAGRLIQLQNLPQNHMVDLEEARELVKRGDYEALSMLYDSVPNVLSELIRTAFIPKEGHKFVVADFSAVEARVLSWLSGETWRSSVFRNNGDIYCASASAMFRVPVEKHGVNSHLRQKGKIAELALGYGGSVGALKAMGALEMGIKEEELQPLVDMWRQSNPNIVRFWWEVDNVVKRVVKDKSREVVKGIKIKYQSGMLLIELPSKRQLVYVKPRIGENQFGGECVTYEGVGTTKKWERIESYGPKFVENIVQAISRDLLCHSMKQLEQWDICAHVHDEVIVECEMGENVEGVCKVMGQVPAWARGLELRADGYEAEFYRKE